MLGATKFELLAGFFGDYQPSSAPLGCLEILQTLV